MARRLNEIDAELIRTELEANLAAALQSVSADRADNLVSTEPPNEYFFYEHSWAMRPPSVFIVPQTMDFRLSEMQSNFINAKTQLIVSVVVEDQTAELAVTKSYRYQAALHQVLDQAHLASADGKVSIVVTVTRAQLSPIYSQAKSPDDTQAAFRREVYLECQIEHYENF